MSDNVLGMLAITVAAILGVALVITYAAWGNEVLAVAFSGGIALVGAVIVLTRMRSRF